MQEGEKITAVVPVKEFDENHFVLMATARGTVKKTPLADFSRPRPSGIIAVTLEEGDYLVITSYSIHYTKLYDWPVQPTLLFPCFF